MNNLTKNTDDKNEDDNKILKFVSLEKLKHPTSKELDEEKYLEWGRGKVGGKEEWIVGKEVEVSSFIPLSSSDFSFSNNMEIKEDKNITIHNGDGDIGFCFINEELRNV